MQTDFIFEDEDDLIIDLDDAISVVTPKGHNELQGLDYTEAGHTGFTPSRLNLLNNVSDETTNERLVIVANVNDVASKITTKDLLKRMVRTADSIPNDLQQGQYLFLKKVEPQQE